MTLDPIQNEQDLLLAYIRAKASNISELSCNLDRDYRALREQVNEYALKRGLNKPDFGWDAYIIEDES
jgi:hypothetical protein